MPSHLKLILSIVVMIVCLTVYYYDHTHDGDSTKWVALLLGPIAAISIWIFPEAKAKEIRREAAKKR